MEGVNYYSLLCRCIYIKHLLKNKMMFRFTQPLVPRKSLLILAMIPKKKAYL